MKNLFFSFLLFAMCILLHSCLSEEDYTISSHAKVYWDTDTLDFDTIIAQQPTNTYTTQIFNPNKKALRITHAYLKQGKNSPFLVNIDGAFLKDNSTADLTISPGDSLRIFVQLTPPPTAPLTYRVIADELVLRLENGNQHSLHLKAVAFDVKILKKHIVTRDTLWSSELPFQIYDSLVIAPNTTLTLQAGTRLLFHPSASLIVHGRLVAQGTLDRPVEMRGDRMGYMFSKQPYDRIPKQWGGIHFSSSSFHNELNYCNIHSGSYGIRCDSSQQSELVTLRLENSILHNVGGHGLYAKMCQTYVANSQITNAGGDCVQLIGGKHQFVHCTIGQFYVFQGSRGVALRFSNHENGQRRPLRQAFFENCLITGYGNDEIMGESSARYKEEPFEYHFHHCLLNTPKVENTSHFVQCLFEEDSPLSTQREKNFSPTFDLSQLLFSFIPSPLSVAVSKADPSISINYPLDLKGKSRLVSTPDIGCYQSTLLSKTK